ncbi:unnamed protein product [Symbiodinium natans]|uniref:Uncharacterized protein n=1 Tax=Symbiodinium natans TaxID=878477 RepID=A0A812UV84_9DINO|nr:unnamed protein product [Symbiodinium natans]
MRTAKYNGHVDWASWTREAASPRASTPPRAMHASAKVSTADWCKNYGYIGTDGQIHWPSAHADHARTVALAWAHADEDAIDAMSVKTATQKLKEGGDLWALLRCAYLAGADGTTAESFQAAFSCVRVVAIAVLAASETARRSKEVGGVEPSTIAKVTPLQKQEKKRTQSEFDRFDGLDLGDFGDLDAASQRVHESLQRQVGSRLLRC